LKATHHGRVHKTHLLFLPHHFVNPSKKIHVLAMKIRRCQGTLIT
jgi:hypothetical protein